MANEIQIDAFPPPKMASRMEEVGINKVGLRSETTFTLAILAGAFIGTGAIFSTVVTTGLSAAGMGFGLVRFFAGLTFCLGLIAVVVAGAELFTGNNLIVMAVASKRVTISQLLRNWTVVYTGNFVGSILTALIMFLTKQYTFSGGALGANILGIANGKCNLGFVQAVSLGIMCNALVCLAVWLCSSARSTTDKILAILFPITAFVAAGFEHSIANMYFIPMGLFVKSFAGVDFWESIGKTAADFSNLTWYAFFIKNLLPVTIGNIIGGAGFVGLVYWFAYLRPQKVVVKPKGEPAKILVVDDDPDFVLATQYTLAEQNYEIRTANNAERALSEMKSNPPDLVLLDVMMASPLDGVKLAQEMEKDPALTKIPVIMISGIDSSEYAQLLPDDSHIPIDAWIRKPLEPEHLLNTVKKFLPK
ncbi:MAG: formate transporter FocA [Chloroflexi bacterium RBG_16_54_18]|nr:MAG: formate transporter FocA [Chloroflexi bacterium RBG_16_54_18]